MEDQDRKRSSGDNSKKGKGKDTSSGQRSGTGSTKLRGLPKDNPAVRLSKTVSWLLRHGAQSEGLEMRADGYVRAVDLLANPKIKSQSLDFAGLQDIVKADLKQRYSLIYEESESSGQGEWWIKANQGHSIKSVKLDLKPILSVEDIPSRTAVHGTSNSAWVSISTQGLSKMTRNHIHLAQGVGLGEGETVIISGMRNSCDILIYIDVPLALTCGIKFFLSDNGVVLTEGNEKGFLEPKFFKVVERVVRSGGPGKQRSSRREAIPGWEERREGNTVNTTSSNLGSTLEPRDVTVSAENVPVTSTLVAEVRTEHPIAEDTQSDAGGVIGSDHK